jgi:hypothetical protein
MNDATLVDLEKSKFLSACRNSGQDSLASNVEANGNSGRCGQDVCMEHQHWAEKIGLTSAMCPDQQMCMARKMMSQDSDDFRISGKY